MSVPRRQWTCPCTVPVAFACYSHVSEDAAGKVNLEAAISVTVELAIAASMVFAVHGQFAAGGFGFRLAVVRGLDAGLDRLDVSEKCAALATIVEAGGFGLRRRGKGIGRAGSGNLQRAGAVSQAPTGRSGFLDGSLHAPDAAPAAKGNRGTGSLDGHSDIGAVAAALVLPFWQSFRHCGDRERQEEAGRQNEFHHEIAFGLILYTTLAAEDF